MSSIAVRHMNHVMSAVSRLGLNVLTDDQSVERVFDLIYEEQGLSADRNSRRMRSHGKFEYHLTLPEEEACTRLG